MITLYLTTGHDLDIVRGYVPYNRTSCYDLTLETQFKIEDVISDFYRSMILELRGADIEG